MIHDKADEIIEKLFQSLLKRYQIGLETSIRGSDFIFDSVHLLYYKCHKINFKLGGSYIGFPDWIKNEKATINPINKKDKKCFQYTVTVALNLEGVKKRLAKNSKTCEGLRNTVNLGTIFITQRNIEMLHMTYVD